MKAIGGYFSLELNNGSLPHWLDGAVEVNSSRHALEYILKSMPRKPRLIYIPYYTCEVVLEPIVRLGIDYKFYHINFQLEIDKLPQIANDEIIIVNNYFGIKDSYINTLIAYYNGHVIVDNAQALYYRAKTTNRAIYSPRKFFGVSDGGFAITPDTFDGRLQQDFSTERSQHLLRRIDAGAEAGYAEFQMNDSSLSAEPLRYMSNLTKRILQSVDYERSKTIRRENFQFLHQSLSEANRLYIPQLDTFECPMIYPFISDDRELRSKLINSRIFVATYWPNVLEWCNVESVEYTLTKEIIPLPIDQRYNRADMQNMLNVIWK